MRINKYLALAGLGSRRKVEELISNKKIKVNGKIVTLLSTNISIADVVLFEGRRVSIPNKFVYYKLHKPKGYVTTLNDEKERKTVIELMRGVHERVFPVGRLDYDTEGLLILTNDGDLTHILTKPSSSVEKTYIVHVLGEITNKEIQTLSKGVDIGGYLTKPCRVRLISSQDKPKTDTVVSNIISKLEITITEGKNRQVRKMIEAIGKEVAYLKRVQIGEIRLGGLSRGEYKELNAKELKYLNSLK